MLTVEDQTALFTLVREAIRAHLLREPPPGLPSGSPALSEVRGVFVTLRKRGDLRGCIGHIIGRNPLAEAVRTLAVSAGFNDRRFPPLTMAEMSDLHVELSILTPPEPADPDAVEIGTHGLLIRLGEASGLLLPQVATDRGWDPPTFLAATCKKAGLPPDAWRDPAAELEWFCCEIYEEPRAA